MGEYKTQNGMEGEGLGHNALEKEVLEQEALAPEAFGQDAPVQSILEQKSGNRESAVYDELEAERAAGVYEEDEQDFRHDQKGMGTVEIILIIVVLVGLVIIFKDQITQIVNSLFGKITQQTGGI